MKRWAYPVGTCRVVYACKLYFIFWTVNALSSAIPEEPFTEVRPGEVLGTPELGDGTVWKNSFPEDSLKKSLETISLRGDSSKYRRGVG